MGSNQRNMEVPERLVNNIDLEIGSSNKSSRGQGEASNIYPNQILRVIRQESSNNPVPNLVEARANSSSLPRREISNR